MTPDKIFGAIKNYFRNGNYGFVIAHDPVLKLKYNDIFFHLNRLPVTIPESRLIVGTNVTVSVELRKERFVVSHMDIGDTIDYTKMNVTTLHATPETDALLRQEYFNRGQQAKLANQGIETCPGHPDSLIAKWWIEGFNSLNIS